VKSNALSLLVHDSNGPWLGAKVNGEGWLRNRDAPAQPRSRELNLLVHGPLPLTSITPE
jgi:hypothetical protein